MNARTQRSEEFQRQGSTVRPVAGVAQLRLMGFSLRQFLTVPYFSIQLLISTVPGLNYLQALAVHAAA